MPDDSAHDNALAAVAPPKSNMESALDRLLNQTTANAELAMELINRLAPVLTESGDKKGDGISENPPQERSELTHKIEARADQVRNTNIHLRDALDRLDI